MISRIVSIIGTLALLISCESMTSAFANPGDPPANAAYLNATERRVVEEINTVRTDPAEYARRFLEPLRAYYHGKLLQYPGQIAISTNEGAKALEEAIRVLESAKPVPPLSPKEGLFRAAHDQAVDQSRTGAVGHSGSDGSSAESRVNRYGRWDLALGENIDYGYSDARRIVTSLLVDDGVPSRGHRINLMNPAFKLVGIATATHPTYRYMCVMDFAGDFK
ncbi:MAG TPA: CAP domain-containing protein [Spirochaetia bacterium]|nr:CAP domain-containing protein [Spirochaetia bacterium]